MIYIDVPSAFKGIPYLFDPFDSGISVFEEEFSSLNLSDALKHGLQID